jgi:GTP cyclohydrolase I
MSEDNINKMKDWIREFLKLIGEDPNREGLRETPERVARMWFGELTKGYRVDPKEFVKTFNLDVEEEFKGIVVIRDVPVRSICEHHLLPFFGYAHIAYIPGSKVLGFSKFARIVDAFAKRLQLQERLTTQIADFLMQFLKPSGLLLIIEAIHTCALVRGVEEPMYLTTQATRGVFAEDADLRKDAISLIDRKGIIFRGPPVFED